MANPCPKCNQELRPDAKFCDNCGAATGEGAAPVQSAPETASAPSGVNWTAILIVVIILGVLGWLLFGNNGGQGAGGGTMASGSNPHGTGDASNPHGGMDQGMGMEDVTNQIADSKARLEADPLDTQALATLYQMFGMIGRQNQLTPYVEAALSTLEQKKDELGEEQTEQVLREIVTAALSGQDIDGGLMALERYAELDPGNTQTLLMLGDLNFDLENTDAAIEWYTKFLDASDPATDPEAYWNAKADRATMYMQLYSADGDVANIELAISELEAVTSSNPEHWNGWFNLGRVQQEAGNDAAAEEAWNKARELSEGPMQIWQVEAELAKLRGEEPPPMPGNESNPHGGMDMGSGGSMSNPHGGMGGMSTPEGTANPHGGMGGS